MAMVNWSEAEFGVSVKEFDQHHQRLFDFINRLNDAMLAKQSQAVLEEILKELGDYTVYHFGAEEKLMQQHGYPGLADHQNQHKLFVDKVQEFTKQFQSGELFLSMKTISFLKDWVADHIRKVDRGYSDFFNSKNIC